MDIVYVKRRAGLLKVISPGLAIAIVMIAAGIALHQLWHGLACLSKILNGLAMRQKPIKAQKVSGGIFVVHVAHR